MVFFSLFYEPAALTRKPGSKAEKLPQDAVVDGSVMRQTP